MNLEPRLNNSLVKLGIYTDGVRNQNINLSNLNDRFGEKIFHKIGSIKFAVLTF